MDERRKHHVDVVRTGHEVDYVAGRRVDERIVQAILKLGRVREAEEVSGLVLERFGVFFRRVTEKRERDAGRDGAGTR